MAKKMGLYKCIKCGNIVETLHEGKGDLFCCGEAMQLLDENTVDASKEKHVPVIEKGEHSLKVRVGAVPHPMDEKHHIEWVEILDGAKAYMEFLHPGDAPEVTFDFKPGDVTARAYCNLHGHWKA
jgi:superoxide reductase